MDMIEQARAAINCCPLTYREIAKRAGVTPMWLWWLRTGKPLKKSGQPLSPSYKRLQAVLEVCATWTPEDAQRRRKGL